jgi:hypothetical protein
MVNYLKHKLAGIPECGSPPLFLQGQAARLLPAAVAS